ncbi:marvel domain-containing protein [Rhypophila decipiens]|uniref:Marvel domain-containing protein n=1 Tax=Rhypophila decipiens TaxID=261697 RepID=A0AAN6YIE6_9PEZI|nr:marvel domain-containing protein [Rhypophila decipiens]
MLSAVAIGLRGFQFLFSVVVLGLAATLISGQVVGNSPTTTRYSTFTGGFGLIVAAVGVAGLFISAIPELIVLGLDALAGVFFIAGGIAWAIGLKGVTCSLNGDSTNNEYIAALNNELINQGSIDTSEGKGYGVYKDTTDINVAIERLAGNCKKGLSDEVMQFILFAIAIGLIVLGYIRMRKGGKTGSTYV